ncbi:hypothetical protein, partial [Mycobacterium tuberculosis]
AQTCLATEQLKSTWLMDSPSSPQIWHLGSIDIPLLKIWSATGKAALKILHKNSFILGEVFVDQIISLRPLVEG